MTRYSRRIRLTIWIGLPILAVLCVVVYGAFALMSQWREWRYAAECYEAILLYDYEEASRWCQEAIRLNENDPSTWFNLGVAYSQLEQYHDAVAAFARAVELDPNVTAYEAARLDIEGYRALLSGEYIRSKKLFREVIQLDGPNSYRLHVLANLLAMVAEYEEAIEVYQQALQLDPDNSDIEFALGHAYSGLAHKAFINRNYERSVELNHIALRYLPEGDLTWYELGLSLHALDQVEEAVKAISRAIELDPDNPRYKQTLEDIQRATTDSH